MAEAQDVRILESEIEGLRGQLKEIKENAERAKNEGEPGSYRIYVSLREINEKIKKGEAVLSEYNEKTTFKDLYTVREDKYEAIGNEIEARKEALKTSQKELDDLGNEEDVEEEFKEYYRGAKAEKEAEIEAIRTNLDDQRKNVLFELARDYILSQYSIDDLSGGKAFSGMRGFMREVLGEEAEGKIIEWCENESDGKLGKLLKWRADDLEPTADEIDELLSEFGLQDSRTPEQLEELDAKIVEIRNLYRFMQDRNIGIISQEELEKDSKQMEKYAGELKKNEEIKNAILELKSSLTDGKIDLDLTDGASTGLTEEQLEAAKIYLKIYEAKKKFYEKPENKDKGFGVNDIDDKSFLTDDVRKKFIVNPEMREKINKLLGLKDVALFWRDDDLEKRINGLDALIKASEKTSEKASEQLKRKSLIEKILRFFGIEKDEFKFEDEYLDELLEKVEERSNDTFFKIEDFTSKYNVSLGNVNETLKDKVVKAGKYLIKSVLGHSAPEMPKEPAKSTATPIRPEPPEPIRPVAPTPTSTKPVTPTPMPTKPVAPTPTPTPIKPKASTPMPIKPTASAPEKTAPTAPVTPTSPVPKVEETKVIEEAKVEGSEIDRKDIVDKNIKVANGRLYRYEGTEVGKCQLVSEPLAPMIKNPRKALKKELKNLNVRLAREFGFDELEKHVNKHTDNVLYHKLIPRKDLLDWENDRKIRGFLFLSPTVASKVNKMEPATCLKLLVALKTAQNLDDIEFSLNAVKSGNPIHSPALDSELSKEFVSREEKDKSFIGRIFKMFGKERKILTLAQSSNVDEFTKSIREEYRPKESDMPMERIPESKPKAKDNDKDER